MAGQKHIFLKTEDKYFSRKDWTTRITLNRLAKSDFTCTRFWPLESPEGEPAQTKSNSFCPTRLSKYSIEVRRRRKSFDYDGGYAEKIPSSVRYEPLSRTVFCELDWAPNTCSASSGKSKASSRLSRLEQR